MKGFINRLMEHIVQGLWIDSEAKSKRSKKLQEVRQWSADATYINEHSDIEQATNTMVDAWFEYWIDVKRKTVRPNTVRNYTERYYRIYRM